MDDKETILWEKENGQIGRKADDKKGFPKANTEDKADHIKAKKERRINRAKQRRTKEGKRG